MLERERALLKRSIESFPPSSPSISLLPFSSLVTQARLYTPNCCISFFSSSLHTSAITNLNSPDIGRGPIYSAWNLDTLAFPLPGRLGLECRSVAAAEEDKEAAFSAVAGLTSCWIV